MCLQSDLISTGTKWRTACTAQPLLRREQSLQPFLHDLVARALDGRPQPILHLGHAHRVRHSQPNVRLSTENLRKLSATYAGAAFRASAPGGRHIWREVVLPAHWPS